MTMIYVNTQKRIWNEPTISYCELLELINKKGFQTVMISYPLHDKKSRTIIAGDRADVLEGMVIDIHRCDSA